MSPTIRKPKPPKGFRHIGTLQAYIFSEVPVNCISLDRRSGVAFIGNDESGNMGPNQGDAYVIVGTVVSDWDLFAESVYTSKKGKYRKGHNLSLEEFEKFYANVRDIVESVHVAAIRKDVNTPSSRVQHLIHLGGLATVSDHIMREENANHIEAYIDYSDQIVPKGLDRKIYELNPYGKDALATTINAKLNPALSSNDYVVHSVASWFAHGNHNLIELIDRTIHYTLTDYKTMELVGGRVNLTLNAGITYRPIDEFEWKDIDLSTETMPGDSFVKGRTDYGYGKSGKQQSDTESESESVRRTRGRVTNIHSGVRNQRTSVSKTVSRNKKQSKGKEPNQLGRDAKGRFVSNSKRVRGDSPKGGLR